MRLLLCEWGYCLLSLTNKKVRGQLAGFLVQLIVSERKDCIITYIKAGDGGGLSILIIRLI